MVHVPWTTSVFGTWQIKEEGSTAADRAKAKSRTADGSGRGSTRKEAEQQTEQRNRIEVAK